MRSAAGVMINEYLIHLLNDVELMFMFLKILRNAEGYDIFERIKYTVDFMDEYLQEAQRLAIHGPKEY